MRFRNPVKNFRIFGTNLLSKHIYLLLQKNMVWNICECVRPKNDRFQFKQMENKNFHLQVFFIHFKKQVCCFFQRRKLKKTKAYSHECSIIWRLFFLLSFWLHWKFVLLTLFPNLILLSKNLCEFSRWRKYHSRQFFFIVYPNSTLQAVKRWLCVLCKVLFCFSWM